MSTTSGLSGMGRRNAPTSTLGISAKRVATVRSPPIEIGLGRRLRISSVRRASPVAGSAGWFSDEVSLIMFCGPKVHPSIQSGTARATAAASCVRSCAVYCPPSASALERAKTPPAVSGANLAARRKAAAASCVRPTCSSARP